MFLYFTVVVQSARDLKMQLPWHEWGHRFFSSGDHSGWYRKEGTSESPFSTSSITWCCSSTHIIACKCLTQCQCLPLTASIIMQHTSCHNYVWYDVVATHIWVFRVKRQKRLFSNTDALSTAHHAADSLLLNLFSSSPIHPSHRYDTIRCFING